MVILLKSASGKIQAGSVSIDLTKPTNGLVRGAFKVENCPDKDAVIEFSYQIEALGDIEGG